MIDRELELRALSFMFAEEKSGVCDCGTFEWDIQRFHETPRDVFISIKCGGCKTEQDYLFP